MAPQARPPPSRTRQPSSYKPKPGPGGGNGNGHGGGRKGGGLFPKLNALDTNPSSYSRTDPFTALNVLRSLLASLPARPSPTHLKLTADEHRLALHLLTLVEPFVGLAPCASRRVLARQPTEILDAIVFHLDAPRDLLALALTCKRLYAVVCPRHAEYRVVRAKASALRVWHHLAVHRSLARNVRRVEILDERAGAGEEAVPRDIRARDTDVESTDDELARHDKQERLVVAALGRMTALRSFKWACNHSLVSFERIWPVLVKCPTIEEVEVNDNVVFQALAEDEAESDAPASNALKKQRRAVLHDLKKVGVHGTKNAFGVSKNPDLTRISTMLHACPNIESLSISYLTRHSPGFFNPVADDFLLCGRWTSLRALTLTNLWCTPHAGLDAASTFLCAHPQLEVLHLDVTFGTTTNGPLTTFKFPANCLPRLRELKASRDFASALLACACDAGPRPLETLKGVRLSGSARDRVFLENLREHGAQVVKRLELAGWNEMEDVRRLAECVPRLIWLDVGKRGGPGLANGGGGGGGVGTVGMGTALGMGASGKAAANTASNFGEWANILAQMPELTTFHGVRFFHAVASTDSSAPSAAILSLSDRSRVRKNDEVASVLAWKCPKLRRLDHWDDTSGRIIVLIRDAERVRYEVRRIKA